MSGQRNSWNPGIKLEYNGPYPRDQLQKARTQLINKLKNPPKVLAQVLPSCGITTRFGPAQHPPALTPAPPSFLPPQPKPSVSSHTSSSSSTTSRSIPANQDLIVLDSDECESDIFNTRNLIQSGVIVLDSDESESGKQDQTIHSKSNNSNGEQLPPAQRKLDMKRKVEDEDCILKRRKAEASNADSSTGTLKVFKPDEIGSKPKTVDILMCDTCNFSRPMIYLDLMRNHLNESHYSASVYTLAIGKTSATLKSIKSMHKVTNEQAAFKSQVILCPDCKDVFKDIFMCGLHHKTEHGSLNGMYSVCPVIKEEIYQYDTCKACQTRYGSIDAMSKHWKEFPLHCPLKSVKPEDITFYFCGFQRCKRMVYDNFQMALAHVWVHCNHQKKNQRTSNPNALCLIARQIARPNPEDAKELPPFDSVPHDESHPHLSIRRQLNGFYKNVLKSKTKKVNNLKEYRELCLTLKCAENLD